MKCGTSDDRNREYLEEYTEEKFFRNIIKNEKPLILDIGAHTGESVLFFNSIFSSADIYSVEPDPASYEKLIKISPDSNKVVNAAIGINTCRTILHRYNISHLNSLYPINKHSEDSLGYAKICGEDTIEVRCLSLDDLVNELDIAGQRIDLLKIDAQGGEVDILTGGLNALKYVDNITLELSLFDFYSKKNSFLEIEQLLSGFELYAITKLSQNPKNLRTDWAEVFYTKVD